MVTDTEETVGSSLFPLPLLVQFFFLTTDHTDRHQSQPPFRCPMADHRNGGSAEAQLPTDLPLGSHPPHSQMIACTLTPQITGGWLHTWSSHPPDCSSFFSFSCSCVSPGWSLAWVYSWSLAWVSQRFCFSNWTLTDTGFLKANILFKILCIFKPKLFVYFLVEITIP